MNDNEYWVRFWSIVGSVISVLIIAITLTSVFSDGSEESLSVSEMKTLLDAGYIKKEVGCYKPVYSFVKDAR